jgi:tetratricopeptide (TPR) repeat protein
MNESKSMFGLFAPRARAAGVFACIALAAAVAGCAPQKVSSSPYATQPEVDRNATRAEQLTRRAVEVMDASTADNAREKDAEAEALLREAEALLREALAADLYHGPAHNNLGVVFLRQGKLYEAANEFEWARKLMPGNPDPRFNLALTLERAVRVDEALAMYATALEVQAEHLPSMQGLARLQIRQRKTDARTDGLLREIAFRGSSAEWRSWAQGELARRGGEAASP